MKTRMRGAMSTMVVAQVMSTAVSLPNIVDILKKLDANVQEIERRRIIVSQEVRDFEKTARKLEGVDMQGEFFLQNMRRLKGSVEV